MLNHVTQHWGALEPNMAICCSLPKANKQCPLKVKINQNKSKEKRKFNMPHIKHKV